MAAGEDQHNENSVPGVGTDPCVRSLGSLPSEPVCTWLKCAFPTQRRVAGALPNASWARPVPNGANRTGPRHPVVPGRLWTQHRPCQACSSAWPLLSNVTFRERVVKPIHLCTASVAGACPASWPCSTAEWVPPPCGTPCKRWPSAWNPAHRLPCHHGSRWTRPDAPSGAPSPWWPWSWPEPTPRNLYQQE